MKHLTLLTATLLTISTLVNAQSAGNWRIGLSTGIYANPSQFSGGMNNAPAEFSHDAYGKGAFDISLRYDHNERWAPRIIQP